MSGLKINTGDWVIVCDGRKALILENVGDRMFPNLRQLEVHEHPDAATRELGTDTPGRVHPSMGTARSSVEQTDWHDEAERAFLHELAMRLDTAVRTGQTKALIVVAPPRALGMLRKAYTGSIRDALQNEVGKDLIKHPIHEIEKQLFS
jgi:protein required for attachment to host cells